MQVGPNMGEGLLPTVDATSPVGQLATAAGDPTEVAGSVAVISAPTLEPLSGVPEELRRLGIDHARLVADFGRAAIIWFTIFVLYGSHRPLSHGALLSITIASAVWLAAFRSVSLEQPAVPIRMAATGVGTAIGLGVIGALDQTAVGLHVSLDSLVVFALGVLGSVLAWDWVVDRTLEARKRVLLVGTAHVDGLLEEELRASPHARFDVVGAIPGAEEITEIVNAQRPDIVVLTDERTYGDAIERLLDARANVRVAGFESFVEYAFGRVPIDQINPAWFMSLLHPRQRIYTKFTKRTFDVVFALIGLIVAAPLLALLAIVVKLAGRARLVPADEDGRGRATVHDLQTSDHALRRGAERRYVLEQGRPADDTNRLLSAPHASGRASSAVERAQRRDVHRRPAPRATGVHRDDRGDGAVLEPSPPGEAGDHGLGAGSLRVRLRLRGDGDEALLRPLVSAEPEPAGRPGGLHAHADLALHPPRQGLNRSVKSC